MLSLELKKTNQTVPSVHGCFLLTVNTLARMRQIDGAGYPYRRRL